MNESLETAIGTTVYCHSNMAVAATATNKSLGAAIGSIAIWL